MAGLSSGPTPWWQLPNNNLPNLQQSAPSGYEYDPVKMAYGRTPTSAGQRTADFTKAALGGIPSLSGLGVTTSGDPVAGGVPSGGPGGTGGKSPAGVPSIQLPDSSASDAASFATAKDKVGNLSRASLDSLNGELGATGMLGGGAQVQGTKDIIQSGAGELGQVARDQAVTDSNRAADFAKTKYSGDITQRGQDIQQQETQAQIQANAAIQAQNAQFKLLSLMMGGLGSGSSAAGSLY